MPRKKGKGRHTCLEYRFRYMLARRECAEDPRRKEVHEVLFAAHRKLGFVGQAMVGKTVLVIVRQPCLLLNLTSGKDLIRRRMGTMMFP
jgi:hypothetical protein